MTGHKKLLSLTSPGGVQSWRVEINKVSWNSSSCYHVAKWEGRGWAELRKVAGGGVITPRISQPAKPLAVRFWLSCSPECAFSQILGADAFGLTFLLYHAISLLGAGRKFLLPDKTLPKGHSLFLLRLMISTVFMKTIVISLLIRAGTCFSGLQLQIQASFQIKIHSNVFQPTIHCLFLFLLLFACKQMLSLPQRAGSSSQSFSDIVVLPHPLAQDIRTSFGHKGEVGLL